MNINNVNYPQGKLDKEYNILQLKQIKTTRGIPTPVKKRKNSIQLIIENYKV